MKFLHYILPLVFITLTSCFGGNNQVEDDELIEDSTAYILDDNNTATITDLQGTYTGILPCADCEGINATLILRKDSTYSLVELKQGTNQAVFNNGGKWTLNDSQVILNMKPLPADRSGKYSIEELGLKVLDKNGQPLTQSDSANYFLKKN